MKKTNSYIRIVSITTSIVASLFILDYALPPNKEKQNIIELIKNEQRYFDDGIHTKQNFGIKTNLELIHIGSDLYYASKKGDQVIVSKTKLLKIITIIEVNSYSYAPYSLYNLFCALPLTVFITGLINLKDLKNKGNVSLSFMALNIVSLIVLLSAYFFNHII
jgi:hypothetical protein